MSTKPLSDPTPPTSRPQQQEQLLRVINNGRTKRRLGRWLALALLLIVAALGVYFWRKSANAVPKFHYITVPAKLGTLAETVTATGTLSPVDSVDVGAEVTGTLTRVLVDVNDHVEQGQVIAEIDPEQLSSRVQESRAQLASANASVISAKATLAEAELKASRLRALDAKGLIAKDDVETAEATLERAKAAVSTAAAQVTVAKAGLTSTESSLSKAIIRAPISGIVLKRSVETGQTVTAGFQTPVLFTLSRDLTKLELTVEVDEADIGKVSQGQSARFVVDAYPDREFESTLTKLHNMPEAEATVVTYAAVLTVDNQGLLLRPGMTATATIVTRKLENQLLVENRALRFEPPAPTTERPASIPLPGFGRGPGGPSGPAASAPKAGGEGKTGKDRVYVLQGPQQTKPVSVEVVATDGTKSAIKPGMLKAGSAVVVEVRSGGES